MAVSSAASRVPSSLQFKNTQHSISLENIHYCYFNFLTLSKVNLDALEADNFSDMFNSGMMFLL